MCENETTTALGDGAIQSVARLAVDGVRPQVISVEGVRSRYVFDPQQDGDGRLRAIPRDPLIARLTRHGRKVEALILCGLEVDSNSKTFQFVPIDLSLEDAFNKALCSEVETFEQEAKSAGVPIIFGSPAFIQADQA